MSNRQWVNEVFENYLRRTNTSYGITNTDYGICGINTIKTIINQKINQEFEELLGSFPILPPVSGISEKENERRFLETGWNIAIEQIRSTIKAKIKDNNGNS